MVQLFFIGLVITTVLTFVAGECPNACSAHGKCGAYDMCICYRNWMANDCSERMCQFGMAHVDSPKGDLDASSGALSGPSVNVIPNDAIYPYGTTEQYPAMVDSESNILTNTAHAYMECSNKGLCDRTAGLCACFPGYDGAACQRASCPTSTAGVCSGHGTCDTIKSIANDDSYNIYQLWDENVSMGCNCDYGYNGADCSDRQCKVGPDPLFHDDFANARFSNVTYQIYTTTLPANGNTLVGNYSIIFYDYTGNPWTTIPIDVEATCVDVINALESLPSNVIAKNTVRCLSNRGASMTGGQFPAIDPISDLTYMDVHVKFTLAFPFNVGKLEMMKLNLYLDGVRPTVTASLDTALSGSTVETSIFANGYDGETVDTVPDLCSGVLVSLTSSTLFHTLTFNTNAAAQMKLLKTCLGDSNGMTSDNVEVYNWDHGDQTSAGTFTNPHLIKLVDATQDAQDVTVPSQPIPDFFRDPALRPFSKTNLCGSGTVDGALCNYNDPPAFYAVLFFDGTNFNLFNRAAADFSTSTLFHVYTTTGYLQLVNQGAVATTTNSQMTTGLLVAQSYYKPRMYLTNMGGAAVGDYVGAVDCISNPIGVNGALDCVNKGDQLMFLNTDSTFATNYDTSTITASNIANNPIYPNLYTVGKVGVQPYNNALNSEDQRLQIDLDLGVNGVYYRKDYTQTPAVDYPGQGGATIYKFHAPTGLGAVGECSNRGLCDRTLGQCMCFAGYTSDNCMLQNALAK